VTWCKGSLRRSHKPGAVDSMEETLENAFFLASTCLGSVRASMTQAEGRGLRAVTKTFPGDWMTYGGGKGPGARLGTGKGRPGGMNRCYLRDIQMKKAGEKGSGDKIPGNLSRKKTHQGRLTDQPPPVKRKKGVGKNLDFQGKRKGGRKRRTFKRLGHVG